SDTALGRTLRTGHGRLRAEIVARVRCSTLRGRPTGSAENVGEPTQHNRSGENQARATVSQGRSSDRQWGGDVKVGRGGERLQARHGEPVLLGEASSWQPSGIGPAPSLRKEWMLGLRITDGPSNGCSRLTAMSRIRVAVLFGGRSGEHDVSCVSARHVAAAFDPDRYQVVPVAITRDGRWLLPEPSRRVLQGGRLE